MKNISEVMAQLIKWEERVRHHDMITNEPLSEEWKIGFVLQMLPDAISTQMEMNIAQATQSQHMMGSGKQS